ncbi:competence type IV pilus assembly protein ComGB [Mesobacillus zeae]|uniref:Type II secretion system F family protein n=1 Tax=Mesobacillus zeae TaxID=1917180 RepID=A0A398B819_9BACI|nr:competence type IV pilus assembly protein ComGB [Mesobacillus zeae]RID83863.1 type II secretion system F family protein [Mesobacillus zeae]
MRWRDKWTVQEQARFLKRTGELLSRGYPLAEAVHSLSFYMEPVRKKDIQKCLADLREGHPFFRTLEDLGFKRELVSYVYFAEQHGGLAEAVMDGSDMVLKRQNDYRKLQQLAAYPLFLAFLTGVLFYFVHHTLLPQFTTLYDSMNVKQGWYASFIYFAGEYFPVAVYIFLFIALSGFIYFQYIFGRLPVIQQREKLIRLPVAGGLLKLLYTQSFSTHLSFLFSGGLSVYEVLNIFENNLGEPFSMEIGSSMKKSLADGHELYQAVAAFPFFEEEFYRVVKHGQDNGKLGQELYFYSRFCLAEIEGRAEKGLRIIQPVLYSLIGLLIISLYLAILLPMFQLIQGI